MSEYLRVFRNAAVSSCLAVGTLLVIVFLLDWKCGHLSWLLTSLCIMAGIAYFLVYGTQLEKKGLALWSPGYPEAKVCALISGICMAGYWWTSIAIAQTTTVADSMIGQMLIPMAVIIFENCCAGKTGNTFTKRSAVSTFMVYAFAYLFCFLAAFIFLWGVENDHSQISAASYKFWLLAPAFLAAVQVCLLVWVERGKSVDAVSIVRAQFRIVESLTASILFLVVAVKTETTWIQSFFLHEHANLEVFASVPQFDESWSAWWRMIGFGAFLGLVSSVTMMVFDLLRHQTETGGAVLLDALDSYSTVLVGLILFWAGCLIKLLFRFNWTKTDFNSFFNSDNYYGSWSILFWIAGVLLIFSAGAVLLRKQQ